MTPPRKGWDVVAGFLILNFAMFTQVPTGPKHQATVGDPAALWGGLWFLLFGSACAIAPRSEERSVLFRLLNANNRGTLLGASFLILAAYLLGRYVGAW